MGVGRHLGGVFFTTVISMISSSDPFIFTSLNYQIHTYVIEQYPPSANMNIATSGNALRLERAAAAALQKPSRTEEANNTACRDSTQMQLLYRRSIKQNWLTESTEKNTKQKKFGS